jgi:hypothetical protein
VLLVEFGLTHEAEQQLELLPALALRPEAESQLGVRANCTAFSKCGAQGCADCVQISTVGSIHDASSIEPAFRNTTPGIDSIVLNIGDPQAEQNRRSVVLW